VHHSGFLRLLRCTREIVITRVSRSEWRLLRELRLLALQTDPLSFGSSYDREAAFSDERWKEWATEDSVGDEMATFIAKRDEQPVGIVAAYRDETDELLFHVIAMWVAPQLRREGIGRNLLSHVEEWIRSCGGRVVQLNVTTAASAARRLYEKAGFKPDGESRGSAHTKGLVEVSLRKNLV
jgi:ribosomal protein S18 acetylase RimI-like enzyme